MSLLEKSGHHLASVMAEIAETKNNYKRNCLLTST